jgi:hypothetical protein
VLGAFTTILCVQLGAVTVVFTKHLAVYVPAWVNVAFPV